MRKYVEDDDVEGHTTRDKIEMFLRNQMRRHPTRWFLRQGIMVDALGLDEEKMEGRSFDMFPQGYATKYASVRKILTDFVEKGDVLEERSGRAFVYKWNPSFPKQKDNDDSSKK
jgi:hypothetical protein